MEEGECSDRVTVTALVVRKHVPRLCAHLHQLLGVELERSYNDILLPADTRSFGLVAGRAGEPAQGVIECLRKDAYHTVRIADNEFWVVPISSLGQYFGWSHPSGVRVQLHTQTGEHYAVTITYDVLPGHDEAKKFFSLIDALLGTGTDSVAMDLTANAARQWGPLSLFGRIVYEVQLFLGVVEPRLCFDDVRLVDPPPHERIASGGEEPAVIEPPRSRFTRWRAALSATRTRANR